MMDECLFFPWALIDEWVLSLQFADSFEDDDEWIAMWVCVCVCRGVSIKCWLLMCTNVPNHWNIFDLYIIYTVIYDIS